ncbi:putative ribonuclease H-like domain-containing protein [Tanacetum coccineum]
MEKASRLTQKHLLLHTTTDKHGVPPTKRLFKVATLDPIPEFIGPWGRFGDPGQPRLTMCDSIFKLCLLNNWSLKKWVPAILLIARRGSESGEVRFERNLQTNSGVDWERAHKDDAPNVKDFANLDRVLSIMASFEDVESFLAVHTPPDDLIRTYLKQEGRVMEDLDHPDKVYKVVKALYGLHQAPRAWYETLANYLLGNGFKRGKINQTLFMKKQKEDILLVQVYVDDIIFVYNKESLQQKEDGIFISQDKYVAEILKKFNYTDVKSMIGSLMYLTTSRPDIIYLKGKPTLGLWYFRDSPFELVAYTDSDYAGATQDRKSTTGGYLLTKGFDAGRFQYMVSSIGMLNPSNVYISLCLCKVL